MSVEGLWCFVTSDVDGDVLANGGVVVLDTQKIYGGDSAIAHHGTYSLVNGKLVGEVESFCYLPSYVGQPDVFNEPAGPTRSTKVLVELNQDGLLVGELVRASARLPIVMKKLRDLP